MRQRESDIYEDGTLSTGILLDLRHDSAEISWLVCAEVNQNE